MKRPVIFCDRHAEDDEVRADETVKFETADGWYEIDVCEQHREEWREFEQTMSAWTSAGRLIEPTPGRRSKEGKKPRSDRLENAAIREWARSIGMDLGERGRIPDDLRRRFRDEVGVTARQRWSDVAQGSKVDGRPEPVGVT